MCVCVCICVCVCVYDVMLLTVWVRCDVYWAIYCSCFSVIVNLPYCVVYSYIMLHFSCACSCCSIVQLCLRLVAKYNISNTVYIRSCFAKRCQNRSPQHLLEDTYMRTHTARAVPAWGTRWYILQHYPRRVWVAGLALHGLALYYVVYWNFREYVMYNTWVVFWNLREYVMYNTRCNAM